MLSTADVADRLLMSERSIRRWIKSGYLRSYKLGRTVRISEADLAVLLERQRNVTN